MRILIELKDGNNNFKIVGTIIRIPNKHSGWESVTYNKQKFQLLGGIRNNHFIDIAHPALKRKRAVAV